MVTTTVVDLIRSGVAWHSTAAASRTTLSTAEATGRGGRAKIVASSGKGTCVMGKATASEYVVGAVNSGSTRPANRSKNHEQSGVDQQVICDKPVGMHGEELQQLVFGWSQVNRPTLAQDASLFEIQLQVADAHDGLCA